MLAQAAVTKSETITALATTIVALTAVLTELTATTKTLTAMNTTLVTELAKKTATGMTRASPGPSNKNDTGHTLNTAGVLCQTHHFVRNSKLQRNLTFVTAQDCTNWGKKMFHLPMRCPETPYNKALTAVTKTPAEAIA